MKNDEIKKRTNEALSYLVDALKEGKSEVLTAYLSAMARFHTYSFGNVMLIARQKPAATHVAGMRAWNTLGRFVKRGEKGIFIMAPVIKNRVERKKTEEQGEFKSELLGFRGVYVFDVSQTEGKELPALTEVTGEVGGYLDRLRSFVAQQGIELAYSERIAPAKGVSGSKGIFLLPGMQPAEEFVTLVHELAHCHLLHLAERRTLTTKTVRETEAEAVAFVVSQAIGLESGSCVDYIQLYHGDERLLRESLQLVQRTACVILGAIAEAPEPEPSPEPAEAAAMLPQPEAAAWKPFHAVAVAAAMNGITQSEPEIHF